MRDFDRVKCLERVYAEFAKYEIDPRYGQSFNGNQIVIQLMGSRDASYVLDILAEAIVRERNS
jgi:hypothetical protein